MPDLDPITDAPALPPPVRHLMLFCDGTNNTLTAHHGDTNVLQLYERFATAQADNPAYLLYYDPGIGSLSGAPPVDLTGWLRDTCNRTLQLALGKDIYANIADGYRFLMQHWQPGDQIYCFGFSRGAFTARAIAGMVNLFGVLRAQHDVMLPTLLNIYFSAPGAAPNAPHPAGGERGMITGLVQKWRLRQAERRGKFAARLTGVAAAARKEEPPTRESLARQVRDHFTTRESRDAWIEFIGVWDTVESVGAIPFLAQKNPSPPTVLGKRFRHVRHALSLDEHRFTFLPRLYDEPGDITTPEHTLRQRWFPGVHCDVGGSYALPEAGLSDYTLAWMIEELAACGMPTPARRARPPAAWLRHDTLFTTAWWGLAGMTPRNMQPRTTQGVPIEVIPQPLPLGAEIHSIWEHRRSRAKLIIAAVLALLLLYVTGGTPYRPGSEGVFGSWTPLLLPCADPVRWLAQSATWHWLGQPLLLLCIAYLLARLSTRGFTLWLGPRQPGDGGYAMWQWLGWLPAATAIAAVAEIPLTALAAHVPTQGWDYLWLALSVIAGGIKSVCLLASIGLYGAGSLLPARWLHPNAPTRPTATA